MEWALGAEVHNAKSMVYLITFARILADAAPAAGFQGVENLTRACIMHAVRDAWLSPLPVGPQGGRPHSRDDELVQKAVVFQEFHHDGSQ